MRIPLNTFRSIQLGVLVSIVFCSLVVLPVLGAGPAKEALEWYRKGHEALTPGESVTCFDQAIRIDPNFGPAYHDRGVAYQKMGELRKAIRDFDQAVRINKKNVSAYYNRGVCYTMIRLYKRAIQDFKKVIELAPKDPRAYNNLAWIYAMSEQARFKHPDLAIQYATKAVELSGATNASYLDTLAEAYYAAGKYQDALKWIEKAVQLDPDSPTLNDHLKKYRKAASKQG